jgi:hypothetical protein
VLQYICKLYVELFVSKGVRHVVTPIRSEGKTTRIEISLDDVPSNRIFLRRECGLVRVIRNSPVDSEHRRHTSWINVLYTFSSIWKENPHEVKAIILDPYERFQDYNRKLDQKNIELVW